MHLHGREASERSRGLDRAERELGDLAGVVATYVNDARLQSEASASAGGQDELLVLDQDAINASGIQPVGEGPPSPRGVEAIVRELNSGPATINGPERHWCIQALVNSNEGYVHVEILDPVYWKNGPALPPEHLEVARELGFEPQVGMWVVRVPLDDENDLTPAASLIETFIARAWE